MAETPPANLHISYRAASVWRDRCWGPVGSVERTACVGVASGRDLGFPRGGGSQAELAPTREASVGRDRCWAPQARSSGPLVQEWPLAATELPRAAAGRKQSLLLQKASAWRELKRTGHRVGSIERTACVGVTPGRDRASARRRVASRACSYRGFGVARAKANWSPRRLDRANCLCRSGLWPRSSFRARGGGSQAELAPTGEASVWRDLCWAP